MWPIVYYWGIDRFGPRNHKLARNVVSFSHAVAIIGLYHAAPNQWKGEAMCVNSISYFLWDLLYMSVYRNEPIFIFHHIASSALLLTNIAWYYKIMGLYYAEMSNLFTYLVYHRLQLGIPCRGLKELQAWWYAYFRVFKIGQILHNYWCWNIISFSLLGIYVLGSFWGLNQFKKLYVINT